MNKRDFLKQFTAATLLLGGGQWLWSSCSGETPQTVGEKEEMPARPKNWMWARPQASWSDEDWKSKLARAKAVGIDAILLEVYNGNQTYYEGGQLPMKDDLLGRLLPLCHSLGLELHAWMWTMPLNNAEMVAQHPDWYAVNGLGQPAHTHPAYVDYYKFLCPCNPEVRDFVAQNVASLAKISELDGVHLDYVRLPDVILAEALQPKYGIVQDKEYPEYDYSYSPLCRQQFKEKTGIDPLKDLKDPSANVEWRQFRYDAVSSMVNDHLVPKAKEKGKMITAAVFPNWESVRQAWHTWNLDAFLPMLYHNFYNADLSFVKTHTALALERMGTAKKPVYSGVFVPSIAPEEMEAAMAQGRAGGSSGTAFFDLTALKEEHWVALEGLVQKS